ncbi:hypothetical protein [Streptomyces phaeofaciens]|uniref:hypothetical protein n=1 Tax=Streptomyces phaeofaciens TaxID=68254 RepID=UPI00367BB5E4
MATLALWSRGERSLGARHRIPGVPARRPPPAARRLVPPPTVAEEHRLRAAVDQPVSAPDRDPLPLRLLVRSLSFGRLNPVFSLSRSRVAGVHQVRR